MFSFAMAIGFGSFAALRTFFCVSDEILAAGPTSLSLFHVSAAVSGLYGAIVARRLTYKFTVVLTLFPIILFIGAVSFARDVTIFPILAVIGLLQGPLWNAVFSYVINLSAQFSYFSSKTQSKMVVRFLSVVNTALSCGFMFAHLFAAATFDAVEKGNNTTFASVDHRTSSCGSWYCEKEFAFPEKLQANISISALLKEEMSGVVPIYIITFCVGCVCLGPILVFFLLDKLTVQLCSQTNKPVSARELFRDLLQTFQEKQLHHVFPMLVFLGIGESFIFCDFVKAYVKCSVSANSVIGYVMLCYGCVSTVFHAALCTVVRHIKRLTVLMAALLCYVGSLCIMWIWKPVTDDKPILYVIAASWAMCDAIWRVLSQSLIYKLFPERWEAPFGIYFIFTSIGSAMGFALCPFTCIEFKICFLGLSLLFAVIPFALLELRLQQEQQAINGANEYYL